MKTRLDVLLVARGLCATRERARAQVLAGHVMVNGTKVTKAGTGVAADVAIEIATPDHPWVGRGGLKLDHALTVFQIDVAGLVALDIGASTGGFTHVLLTRGAAHVVALDVGHNQLDWRLRSDARVTCLEGVNARHLTRDDLPPTRRVFDIVTADVSFISLRHILPVIPALLGPAGRAIVLVKPQIVRDDAVHAQVVDTVRATALRVGLTSLGVEPSPVTGAEGNREFLMLLAPAAAVRSDAP
jgi:23S rRNA (cytidine1920-2'-O)/16S rRNA (cytidine1409-2'-O)-methyltransferase